MKNPLMAKNDLSPSPSNVAILETMTRFTTIEANHRGSRTIIIIIISDIASATPVVKAIEIAAPAEGAAPLIRGKTALRSGRWI